MDNKRVILTIDSKYLSRYNLPSQYLGKNIVLYSGRITHFAKHELEFSSKTAYNASVNNIDKIIKNPEFISYDPKNNSLEFVKKMLDDTLVAVRVSASTDLKIKTIFPINEAKKTKLRNRSF